MKYPSVNLNKTLILSSAVLLFSACSVLTPKTAESVNKYAAKHQYEKALTLYAQIPTTEQELIDIKVLEKAREKYLAQLITEANKEKAKHNFDSASDILESGSNNLPANESIQKAINSLENVKQAYTDKYQLQYDEEYAHFLLKEAPILDRLEKTQSNKRSFNKHYKAQLNDRHRLSIIMGESGITALNAGHIKTASRQLKLAQNLQEDKRWEEALTSIKKKTYIKNNKRKKDLARKKNAMEREKALAIKQHDSHLQQLKQRFDTQLSLTEMAVAKTTLAELEAQDKAKTQIIWIQASQKKLKQAIDAQLAADLQRGKVFYSKGQINKAIEVWKNAQSYAPDSSELKEHVRRAETFQARYKSLNK